MLFRETKMKLIDSGDVNKKDIESYLMCLEEKNKELQEKLEEKENELKVEKRRFQIISDNLPDSSLLRFEVNLKTLEIKTLYFSKIEQLSNLAVGESIEDTEDVFRRIYPDDLLILKKKIVDSVENSEIVNMEFRYFIQRDDIHWMKISVLPYKEDNKVVIKDNKVIMEGYLMDITTQKTIQDNLISERNRLKTISDNFPGGALLQFEMSISTLEMQLTFLGKNWEEVTGLTIEETKSDMFSFLRIINPEDTAILTGAIRKLSFNMANIIVELRMLKNNETRWIEFSVFPHIEDEYIVGDGFILDITNRKRNEAEILNHREKLVELSSRQELLIKVLQILQSADDLSQAMNEAFSEIGKYVKVSRIHLFEKNANETAVNNTVEWCNEGVSSVKENLQNIPIEFVPWFDMFEEGQYVCTSERHSNIDDLNERMNTCGVDSLAIFPLTSGKNIYGFVDFNICTSSHDWNEDEVELLKSLSHIISTTRNRFLAEISMYRSHQTLQNLMNNINALILVTDFDTLKILFVNERLKKLAGDNLEGKECWKVLQLGKSDACEWCPKKYLLDKDNNSTGVYRFEYPFEMFNQYLAIDSMAIEWIDGRRALLEVCFDITQQKVIEKQLIMERDRLQVIGDNFPDGSLFRLEINPKSMEKKFTYLSATWEKIMGVSIEKTLADSSVVYNMILPEFFTPQMEEIKRCTLTLQHFSIEYQRYHKNNETRWIQVSSYPHKVSDDIVIFDGFTLDITNRKIAEQELISERDRLKAIGDHFPEGSLFSFEIDVKTLQMKFLYLGGTWEDTTGLNKEDSLKDIKTVWDVIFPEDLKRMESEIKELVGSGSHFFSEIRFLYKKHEPRWLLISSHRRKVSEDKIVSDGFILDITSRKDVEAKLAKHQEDLEQIIKERTENLENANEKLLATNEELEATNEELEATNDELKATTDSLYASNEELNVYKTCLESMVQEKTAEIVEQQKILVKLSELQTTLINILQALQMESDVAVSMDKSLDIIGRFTNVSRVQIWENNTDGKTYGCSYEWCRDDIEPVIHFCQNILIEQGKPWFDLLEANNMICSSDISTLDPAIKKMLEEQRVKAIVVLPLSIYGNHFGFISYTVVEDKIWSEEEIQLLTNIAQVFSNVIKRRQVETAMQLSQQTLRMVMDNVDVNILVADFDSLEVLFTNRLFKEWSGCEAEGRFCWQCIKADITAPCDNCPRALLRDNNNLSTGVRYWEDYNPVIDRWFLVGSSAIEWVDGKLVILELSTDITDRKLNEIELVNARQKAEESDRLKSAFLANMSHEIRTPLNAIVGFSNVLTSRECNPKETAEYKNIIQVNTDLLLNLINNILDFSRLEVDKLRFHTENCDIVNLCHTAVATINHTKRSRAECIFVSPVESFVIQTDPSRLQQILLNLLSNASKFTPEGIITLTFEIQQDKNQVLFSVTDTGCGIPEDKREVVFQRFEKLNEYVQGTGLGLPICKLTISKLGGDIWVDPDYENGAKFVFSHPITRIDNID